MTGRDRRRGIDDLVETTPMPDFARRLQLLAATALWAILAFLVFGGYMFGRTALQATAGGPALWPVLIVLAALLAQASWGFLIGSILPSRFTAPLTAIAVLMVESAFITSSSVKSATTEGTVQHVQSSNWLDGLFATNLSSVPYWQLLFYPGLTATALDGLWLIKRRDIARCALLLGAVAIVGGSAVMLWGESPRYDVTSSVVHNHFGQVIKISNPVQPTPICAGQPVTVCTDPAYKPILAAAVIQANQLVAPLLGLPNVPLRVEPQDTDLSSQRNRGAWLDIARFASTLVANPNSAPDGYIQNEAQLAIRAWLMQQANVKYGPNCAIAAQITHPNPGWPPPDSCAAADRFAQLSSTAQRNWLDAHYVDLRAGKLALADLP